MTDGIMFLTVPDDPKKITVAITIKDGDDRERITEVMWNAYLTWHKVNDGEWSVLKETTDGH